MPHEGFADPIASDRTRFRSNMPVSELTEHVTRATKASNGNSTPLVVETMDGATVTKTCRPLTKSQPCVGARGRLDLQGDLTHGRRMIAKILGRGYVRIQDMYSPKFHCPSLGFRDIRPQQRQRGGSHSEAGKGAETPFLKTVAVSDLFLILSMPG